MLQTKLKGINLGGWLMMEGYLLGGRNIPESSFKSNLAKIYGQDFVPEFTKKFRANFITAEDFSRIKKLGFNCVRLPFNYRLLEEPDGLDYLKQTVKTLSENQLYIILDMHAAPGSQNPDWHSDSTGSALFWKEEKFRRQYYSLWEKLAKTFKGEAWVAGYDIMNEAVADKTDLLRAVYQKTIKTIRKAGDQHTIFLEGNKYAREVEFLEEIEGENLALSLHFYEPVEFTFNWQPDTKYPGKIAGVKWDSRELKNQLQPYAEFGRRKGWPVYVGEFGVASRCSYCGQEFQWVKDILAVFEQFGFHWTYWTYKSVKGMDVPDGLFQLSDSSGLVGTKSICSGLENLYNILGTREKEYFALLRTENFKLNPFLAEILG